MRHALYMMLVVLVWCIADVSSAAESIRVLLDQQVKKVTVQGDQGLIVAFPNGVRRSSARPVSVSVLRGHLALNGTQFHAPVAVFHARGGDLVIGMSHGIPTGQRRDVDRAAKGTPRAVEPIQSLHIGGSIQVMVRDGALLVINALPLEEYVKGVVPSEIECRLASGSAQGASRCDANLCHLSANGEYRAASMT